MITVIGQKHLVATLSTYTFSNMPATTLILGPKGGGKHFITERLAKQLGVELVVIDPKCTAEDLVEYSQYPVPRLYLIELIGITEKAQNKFLKFIEEPSKSVYVILTATSEAGVLPTILNRCIKYNFEPYTKEQIEQITNTSVNEQAFKIFQTPGKLLNLTEAGFNDIMDLAGKTVMNIGRAEYANALVIATKINYKDLYNKIDFDLFLDAVEYLALEDYKKTTNEWSFAVFKITNLFKQYATQQRLIKETLMLNYITTLWEALHG